MSTEKVWTSWPPKNPDRSGGKKQVLTTDCPSRNRINVPDLKICMAQKLAAQLAAQRPNTSLVHMLVQKVSWLSVRLCNILHREKKCQEEYSVVKFAKRKVVFEQTCLKTRFSVPRCQKEPASQTLNKNLTPAADCTRPERRAKAKPRCLKKVYKPRAASRAPRRFANRRRLGRPLPVFACEHHMDFPPSGDSFHLIASVEPTERTGVSLTTSCCKLKL
jgi:hypothetical protein